MNKCEQKHLQKAKELKNDEFYTFYKDIENELQNYKDQLKDKIIYCNCDNPKYSNFYKYFKDNFKDLKLKLLISTYYNQNSTSKKTIFNGIKETTINLKEDGSFKSIECLNILKDIDIVVTNPPFSLFREYIDLLHKSNKKFLILGSFLATTYRDVFPLIQQGKINLGFNINILNFKLPDQTIKKVDVCWFTNLKTNIYRILISDAKYKDYTYTKYDNFDAIEIPKLKVLPIDYKGYMGVPITFLKYYNKNEYELVKFRKGYDGKDLMVNGKCQFSRIIIKKK